MEDYGAEQEGEDEDAAVVTDLEEAAQDQAWAEGVAEGAPDGGRGLAEGGGEVRTEGSGEKG